MVHRKSFTVQRRTLKNPSAIVNNQRVLTPRLLLVLRAVIQRGTLTAAATALGYTVSAVSQQLSQLEREAGSALLEKAGRGVRPTAAGLLLAEHANRILAAVDDAEGALADLRAGRTGRLRVVSFHSAGETLLPQAIAALRRQMPAVHVMPVVDETEGALTRLRAGEVELVIVVEPFGRADSPADDLHRVHLLDDQYRLLLPDDHPLARRRVIDLSALATTDWIATTGPATYVRDATITACRRAGFTPRFVAEGDEFTVTQGYVAAGLGAALVPVLALGAVREHVRVRKLRTPPEPRHIWLATRPALAAQPPVHRMITALKAAAGQTRQP
jgi:DNA-binding transcriptional LysR family regulator